MERRFRNPRSPKYLGSDKRFKVREQEGVSAQRKRQGFDVAVKPLSGQPRLFGRPRRRFFPRTNKCFSAEAVALVLTARTDLPQLTRVEMGMQERYKNAGSRLRMGL